MRPITPPDSDCADQGWPAVRTPSAPKMMKTNLFLPVLIISLCGGISARATELTACDISRPLGSDMVTFQLVFDSHPDFFTLDQYGRPVDEFQFDISPGPSVPHDFSGISTIIRGGEMHINDDIRFRGTGPGVDLPVSGGWGAIRSSVSFTLSGNMLTFSAPDGVIGADPNTGAFGYILSFVHDGGATGQPNFYGEFGAPVPDTIGFAFLVPAILCLVHYGFRKRLRTASQIELAPALLSRRETRRQV